MIGHSTLRRGFTIVELLIIIVVIGILATLVVVAYTGISNEAIDKTVLSDVDGVESAETQYALSNMNVAGLAWYSGVTSGTNGSADPTLNFVPSKGNIIDVVVNSTDYCIRIYNVASKSYKKLASAAIKESSPGACSTLTASVGALADTPV